MARTRTSAAGLARLLNSAARPIYVLDDDQRIVFCNDACLNWVGQTSNELSGIRCAYHSSPAVAGLEAIAAGLCPPPAAFDGNQAAGAVAAVDADGEVHRRAARFVRVEGAVGEMVGLVVLVAATDLAGQEAASDEREQGENAELHERVRKYRQQFASRYRIDRLVGESPAMRRARAQVELAANSRASVLITGPAGSGRQLAAEAIHYANPAEPRGTLIPLACSVLGAELIESALAAVADRRTIKDNVAGSTLLLTDIDRLPREVQAEAARVLTSRSFPLRLIGTASQSLWELAGRGDYLPELAATLSTLVIELPSLAERREDLPLLAQVFLEEVNARGRRQLAGFTSEALDALDAYRWPGNVDELVLVVSESHAKARGVEVTVADLPDRIHLAADAAAHPRPAEQRIILDEFLGRVERELIGRALARAKGNKTKAAKLLGMTRPRLYRRLVQLGLEEPNSSP